MTEQATPRPHDLAASQIDAWRGRCIALFARAERVIGQSLEVAVTRGKAPKLRHLGGQRLADLLTLTENYGATPKQTEAVRSALSEWRVVESRRAFFAHGVATALLDRQSEWYAVLEFTAYRGNVPHPERWTLHRSEAEDFENRLAERFAALSRELGQFRKRLTA